MQKLRPIMIVGTCSDAGKSVINSGLCRIFKQDGYSPAPFKAQNMSLNSYSTPEGLEIGRAQAVQAEACGVPCHTDMNPVLLKPTTDQSSQVILNGKPIGNQTAREYFMGNNKQELFKEAIAAYNRLSDRYSPIVLEGAGSISELNLKKRDITNMSVAVEVDAATYLVSDIDKGGVFASVFGSIELLDPEERAKIKGIIINKFRGDETLFDEGKKILERLTGVPVVGVIPFFTDIHIEEEDSVALENKSSRATITDNKVNVAVVLLPRMSNFTDFNIMEVDERFHLYYSNNISEIEKADIIIIPGSKNTISDLKSIQDNGVAQAIVKAYKGGKKVIGICGGYQMMGVRVEDPEGLEGSIKALPGLGLIPQITIIEQEKRTEQTEFYFQKESSSDLCKGYEIHMGSSNIIAGATPSPLNTLTNGESEGYWLDDNCWGSYMHGILDNSIVLDSLTKGFNTKERASSISYQEFKEENYNKLADHLRKHLDMDYIYTTIVD